MTIPQRARRDPGAEYFIAKSDADTQAARAGVRGFLTGALLGALAVAYVDIISAARAEPTARVYSSPARDLEAIDVAVLARAGGRIDFAAYALTDVPIIGALAGAAARGVKIRLYLDRAVRNDQPRPAAAITGLAAMPGVEWKYKRGASLMHRKGYCVDGSILRTGSANFSPGGEKRQDNDLVLIEGEGACDDFNAAFDMMWERDK